MHSFGAGHSSNAFVFKIDPAHQLPLGRGMRAVVLPQLSGKSRKPARNIRCLLFSFYYPDFCAAVPALYIIIGIPALLRDNQP